MNKQHLLLVALLLSMAVNLLIAGVVIGRGGFHAPQEPPPLVWAAQRMKPETRQLVGQRLRRQLPEVRPLRGRMQTATRAVSRAANAEDFSPEALAEALRQWRQASQDYQSFIHENLVEIAADLPREERVALLRAAMLRGRAGNLQPPSPPLRRRPPAEREGPR